MSFRTASLSLFLGLFVPGVANAVVVQTLGSGSAVTTVNASADFESGSATSYPYSEGGIDFSVTNLGSSNPCGFAGCPTHAGFFPGFSGNYLYANGSGLGGYWNISATSSDVFSALEFVAGNGNNPPIYFAWEAFLNGSSVGSVSKRKFSGKRFWLSLSSSGARFF
jgi:hypothetical protein